MLLAVDLDGTLVRTDTLLECALLFIRQHPWQAWRLLLWALQGKVTLKSQLAQRVQLDVAGLPYRTEVLDWIHQARSSGQRVVLATASHRLVAQAVADHLGLFDDVLATEAVNLSRARKAEALQAMAGPAGYAYIGNSADDLLVWRAAKVQHWVDVPRSVQAKARKLHAPIGLRLDRDQPVWRAAWSGLRPHQWAKNLLLIVPLLASHQLLDVSHWLALILAFVAFSACASAIYLINDLLDLPEDRLHSSKKYRMLASGQLPILTAAGMVGALLLLAVLLALTLPPLFGAVLALYVLTTTAYSIWLKRLVLVDVMVLAVLYTVRVIAGAAALELHLTAWMLAFSLFIFLSLALVKRYTELQRAAASGGALKGRDYLQEDLGWVGASGLASSYAAVVVLALYIHEVGASVLYPQPAFMWLACLFLLYWLQRVWMLTWRGQMHDDPVVFALRDAHSRWVGLLFGASFALASLGGGGT